MDEYKIVTPWLKEMADDIDGMATEGIFASRWMLVETYHNIGRRIVADENYKKYYHGHGEILTDLSNLCSVHVRDIYRAMKFYSKYPDLDLIPEGKNISWNKIVTKYLPDTPPEEKPEPETCPTCGQAIRNRK